MARPELLTEIPGPRSRELGALLRQYESPNITFVSEEWPIFWERADGCNVWDADRNRFLDLTSAFGVASLGHTYRALGDAMRRQSERLGHAMGDVHPSVLKAELCARLSQITFERWGAGRGKVALGNSGFEAVEIALKTSFLHSGKPGVLAFTGGYHGLGFGALTATGLNFFREPFRPQLKEWAAFVPYPHCYRCPFGETAGFRLEGRDFPNCSSACLERLHDEICDSLRKREIGCVLVEPVQGRGGCVVPPRDFLPMLRAICDAHKILLICDEVFTGFNRTAALFACEHTRVVPDLICLGKSLTGGFPLSACVGRTDVMDAWPASAGEALHTSTFLGNPVGCAMALASIEEHSRPQVLQEVRERGAKLKDALRALSSPAIGDVRGVGLMLAVELVGAKGEPATALASSLVKRALHDGIILLADSPAGNVLSFTPPFSISDDDIAFAVEWLGDRLMR